MCLNEYYNNFAISQSYLKTYLYGNPNKIIVDDDFFEESDAITIGNIVDKIITSTQEDILKSYHIVDIKKPSDTICKMCDFIKNKLLIFEELDKLDDYILEAHSYYNHQPKHLKETKLKNFKNEETKNYWKFLWESEGKKIVGKEEILKAFNVAQSLLTNKFTKDKLIGIYQHPVYFKYRDLDCKMLLDVVEFKDYIYPRDIKSTGVYTNNFRTIAKKLRYDIQAAFYTEGLKITYDKPIAPFEFIVESTKKQGFPLIYRCTKDDLYVGKHGTSTYYVNDLVKGKYVNPILGFDNLIDLHLWYQDHPDIILDKEVYENDGIMDLNLFNV